MADVETSYYLRVRVKDQLGVLADIARILADSGISIDAMLQKGPGDRQQRDRHRHPDAPHARTALRRRDGALVKLPAVRPSTRGYGAKTSYSIVPITLFAGF